MAKLPFNVSANTAKLIGRENIANLDGAIIELVKNTYDADAKICILYYDDASRCLWLIDNGFGMTQDIINENWMTIGNSSKTKVYTTPSGRIQTGEKGIGRFALDRVASSCVMHTISKTSNFIWSINWDCFSEVELITEVFADIENSSQSIFEYCSRINNPDVLRLLRENNFSTGTAFCLSGLRDQWAGNITKRLRESLSKMLPPDINSEYRLYFFANEEDSIKEARVESAFLDEYDYKITFAIIPRESLESSAFFADRYDYKMHQKLINGNSSISNREKVCLTIIHRNEFDFGNQFDRIIASARFTKEDEGYFRGKRILSIKSLDDLIPENPDIDLGCVYCDLYFYKLASQEKNEARYYYKEFSGRGKKYKEISGVKIYRDCFLVRPYGLYGSNAYDWLDLSTRKAASPAAASHPKGRWRVHVNQMCGQVHISRLSTALPDKSSREGLIETPEFELFRELIIDVIELFEEDRQYVIRKLNDLYKAENQGEAAIVKAKEALSLYDRKRQRSSASSADEKESEDYKSTHDNAYDSFRKAMEYQEERIEDLEQEMGLLRALATTGVLVNTYMHEIKALTTKMNMGIKEALDVLEEEKDVEKSILELRKLRQMRKSFSSWFKVTLEAVQKDKRKMKRNSINSLIKNSVSTWKELQSDGIQYEFIENDCVEMRCFPYDIESIMNNLIANTTSKFKESTVEFPKIIVELSKADDFCLIEYSDNGPGLSDSFRKNPEQILQQGKTDRKDASKKIVGTGMGLWIVNCIVKDYDGHIDLSSNKKITTGFKISIYLKSRKERS